jgi:hypothetical protein
LGDCERGLAFSRVAIGFNPHEIVHFPDFDLAVGMQ